MTAIHASSFIASFSISASAVVWHRRAPQRQALYHREVHRESDDLESGGLNKEV